MALRSGMSPQRPAAGSSSSSAQRAGRFRTRGATRRGLPVISQARPVDRQRVIHQLFPRQLSWVYVYTACYQGYFLAPGTSGDLAQRFEKHRLGLFGMQRDDLTEMVVMSGAMPRYQALEAETRLIWLYLREGREVLNPKQWTIGEMRRGGRWFGVLHNPMPDVYPRAVIRNPTTRHRNPCPRAWYWPIP
jgi:hypothetical protein